MNHTCNYYRNRYTTDFLLIFAFNYTYYLFVFLQLFCLVYTYTVYTFFNLHVISSRFIRNQYKVLFFIGSKVLDIPLLKFVNFHYFPAPVDGNTQLLDSRKR